MENVQVTFEVCAVLLAEREERNALPAVSPLILDEWHGQTSLPPLIATNPAEHLYISGRSERLCSE